MAISSAVAACLSVPYLGSHGGGQCGTTNGVAGVARVVGATAATLVCAEHDWAVDGFPQRRSLTALDREGLAHEPGV
eukprot:3673944-Prymnesium_polylepis.2